jgi:D-tyrosyl-tRNA(Tyr) deacylase
LVSIKEEKSLKSIMFFKRYWHILLHLPSQKNLSMRALIQRVSKASVKASSGHSADIKTGLLVFLGIENEDNTEDVQWLSGKISRLRIFGDENGIMNLSLSDISAEIMIISQFTLHASTKKGNRPSYVKSAPPEKAIPLYEAFLQQIQKDTGIKSKTGVFGDHMDVSLVNDGPVSIIIDTKNKE